MFVCIFKQSINSKRNLFFIFFILIFLLLLKPRDSGKFEIEF